MKSKRQILNTVNMWASENITPPISNGAKQKCMEEYNLNNSLNHQFVLNLKNPTGEKFIVLLKHIFPWCKWALFGNSKKEGKRLTVTSSAPILKGSIKTRIFGSPTPPPWVRSEDKKRLYIFSTMPHHMWAYFWAGCHDRVFCVFFYMPSYCMTWWFMKAR